MCHTACATTITDLRGTRHFLAALTLHWAIVWAVATVEEASTNNCLLATATRQSPKFSAPVTHAFRAAIQKEPAEERKHFC